MYEEVCYEKPFLKQVIARTDFVAPLDGLEKSLPTKLANVISEYFPISEPTEAIAQAVNIEITKDEIQHHKMRYKQWNFYGTEREKQISIASPFMVITYQKYANYEDMQTTFTAIVEATKKALPDARVGRFGLRYINVIEGEYITANTLGEYITPSLLNATAFFAQPEYLTRLFHAAELKYDELSIKFQFGMPNPDYPAIMKRLQFVLDLDGYTQSAHELSDSIQHMDQAHKYIQALFEKSITNKLRERMKNVNPSAAVQ